MVTSSYLYKLFKVSQNQVHCYYHYYNFEKQMGGSRSFEESIKVGPWGGPDGTSWIFNFEGGISEIVIFHGLVIDSISFKTETFNGEVEYSNKFGGGGGRSDKILLDWPREFLTSISGTYGQITTSEIVVKSLCFHTNRTSYGPFGSDDGSTFSFPMEDGVITGFHGRAGGFVDAIGVYAKPILVYAKPILTYCGAVQESVSYQEIILENKISISDSLAGNIIANHNFSKGLHSWNANSCSGFVVSSESSYSSKSGRNYAVVTNRKENWHCLEQDITCRVIAGSTYAVFACVGLWGPLHGTVEVKATLKLEYPHSATRYLFVGRTSVSKERWEMLEGTFSLSSLPNRAVFYINGPSPALDILVKSVVITRSSASEMSNGGKEVPHEPDGKSESTFAKELVRILLQKLHKI